MPLTGSGFLCLWNDFDESRAEEYERWHSLEHVPERVAAPGFLSGRRYGDFARSESRYMTLYDLQSLAALDTPDYAELQREPTPWSAKMRPHFRNFLRLPCATLASEGTGCAGQVGTLALSLGNGSAASDGVILDLLREGLAEQRTSAFHLGRADRIPAYGVFASPELSEPGRHHLVVLQEATTEAGAQRAVADLLARITALDAGVRVLRRECSSLLFSVARDEVVPRWQRRPAASAQQA
ncbi:hypothetical protein PVT71_15125 [Salipiger sp. H15]|uniref:Uncharacterized protein n=1 Tax=Alloyangia sp. H15 TaxID=3029062 RepID=A0AAU8ANY3_9RHOB